MNILVDRTIKKYRFQRELANYSIIDIQNLLRTLSEEGLIWCLKNMPDLTDGEEILINHFLNLHQNLQVYDNL